MSVLPGKTGRDRGHVFLIRIGERYYECVKNVKTKKWTKLRCKTYRKANGNGEKCGFKMKVKNISNVTEEENEQVFWQTGSWQVLEDQRAPSHSCTGCDQRRIEGSNIFRQEIRDCVNRGQSSYRDIRAITGIDSKYNIGDDKAFKRVFSSLTAKKQSSSS